MVIESVKKLCIEGAIRWTDHAIVRIAQRGISRADVKCALMTGGIIEQYPEDYPYPSCLMLGNTLDNSPLHVVCGIGNDELWVITAYFPDSTKWNDEYKNRMEK